MNEANPYGKTTEEIERTNRWLRLAIALGKLDEFSELLETERVRAVESEQTKHDRHDRQWFNSGWEACRREVLATAEHRGPQAAVDWAKNHPAGQHEQN
jgi:hypothetical protein